MKANASAAGDKYAIHRQEREALQQLNRTEHQQLDEEEDEEENEADEEEKEGEETPVDGVNCCCRELTGQDNNGDEMRWDEVMMK
ncbi:hypothetical protein TWF696_002793 [Orbilia brochopaga]|uniref:Uncharacterized protein n=1 Tax=Orbilia brochopaga TaxID=3140254 RepID=A0AAV9U0I6_9PEZI